MESCYASKRLEVRLEAIDLFLGISREIVTSPPYSGRKKRDQIHKIMNLVKDEHFYNFLNGSNIIDGLIPKYSL